MIPIRCQAMAGTPRGAKGWREAALLCWRGWFEWMSKEDGISPESFSAMLASVLNPLVLRCGGEIAACSDFPGSTDDNLPFVEFSKWIDTRPNFVANWRSSPELEQSHYSKFMSGIDNARNSFLAARYHLANLAHIETKISEILARYNLSSSVSRGSVLALGINRKWDFEYQSFVLQYRMCLEYFTIGIGTYFNSKVTSFPRFSDELNRQTNDIVANALAPVWQSAHIKFQFMRDIRNNLIHERAIQSCTINITANGYRYIGGGEEMGIKRREDKRGLAERLSERLSELHLFIANCLDAFRTAVVHQNEIKPPHSA